MSKSDDTTRVLIYHHMGLSIKIRHSEEDVDNSVNESERLAWLLHALLKHMAIGDASRVLANLVALVIDEDELREHDIYEPLCEAEITFCHAAETMRSHWKKRDDFIDDLAKKHMSQNK